MNDFLIYAAFLLRSSNFLLVRARLCSEVRLLPEAPWLPQPECSDSWEASMTLIVDAYLAMLMVPLALAPSCLGAGEPPVELNVACFLGPRAESSPGASWEEAGE